jgi:xanthine dehydrogenase accessory factor
MSPAEDPACAVAHGEAEAVIADRTLVAVFASPVAGFLLHFGADLGFHALLVEPDRDRAAVARAGGAGFEVLTEPPARLDDTVDVVVTDHHRPELGTALRDFLLGRSRWIGILGNPRHEGPHVRALAELGVSPADVARVHRPVGLNIGSRTPAEIAVATLAGLLADRNGRPGGFDF